MRRETAIEAEGRVIEALPQSLFRVEFRNGHRALAYLSGRMRRDDVRIETGSSVRLEMSPFDMSKGRIVAKEP